MNTTLIEVSVTDDQFKELEALCLFYGVSGFLELVEAMRGSIERLQERLHKETNPLYTRNYRYG